MNKSIYNRLCNITFIEIKKFSSRPDYIVILSYIEILKFTIKH